MFIISKDISEKGKVKCGGGDSPPELPGGPVEESSPP